MKFEPLADNFLKIDQDEREAALQRFVDTASATAMADGTGTQAGSDALVAAVALRIILKEAHARKALGLKPLAKSPRIKPTDLPPGSKAFEIGIKYLFLQIDQETAITNLEMAGIWNNWPNVARSTQQDFLKALTDYVGQAIGISREPAKTKGATTP